MSTTNQAAPPTAEQAQQRLAEGLARLDTAQAEGLSRAALLQDVQAAGAARERDRLTAKYGAGHPRVRAANGRVAAESGLARAVAAHAEQSVGTPPRVNAQTWMVHGRVLQADGKPAAGLTVSLSAPGGGWERAAGHVCTDARGRFALRHTPAAGGRLQLVVSDGAVLLHRDPRVLAPVAGTIDAVTIVLPDGAGGACTPPADGDRPGGAEGGVWSVRGTVTDAEGKAAAGLVVTLYDRDLLFDDRLGRTTTNADGAYRFTYRTGDFRDFVEARPDLYLTVLDVGGDTLHTAPVKVRAEAGREEVIDVKLPKRRKH